MEPPLTWSSRASERSVNACGTAIVSMPSCTTPMFSKMPLTSHDTQPAMLAICHASGSAVATAAALACPASHSHTPSAAVPTTRAAFMQVSVAMKRVVMRMWAAMRPRCSTIASRTYESSSAARANSFTVGKLV